MSGHSKWAKIKRSKGLKDQKRGMTFTKLAKAITIAASEGGGDPGMNFALRLAIEKAKAENMPGANIERAVKKGTGEIEGGKISKISYEGYAPHSIAIIVDCSTDNTNRTYAEVKNIIESNGGKMASAGSVSWQFEEKGLIVVKSAKLKKSEKYGGEDTYESIDKDNLMMEIMEIPGVADILESESEDEEGIFPVLEVYTSKTDFAHVDKALRDKQIQIISSELVKESREKKDVSEGDKEKLISFIEKLDEHDDVDNVWTDLNL